MTSFSLILLVDGAFLVAIGLFALIYRGDAWAGSVGSAISGLGLTLTVAGGDLLLQHHLLNSMVALILCLSAGMVLFSLGGVAMTIRWGEGRKEGSSGE